MDPPGVFIVFTVFTCSVLKYFPLWLRFRRHIQIRSLDSIVSLTPRSLKLHLDNSFFKPVILVVVQYSIPMVFHVLFMIIPLNVTRGP